DGLSISDDRELRRSRIGHCCRGKIGRAFRKCRFAATVAGDVAWERCARIGFFIADSRMVRDLAGGGGNRLRRESTLVAAGGFGAARSGGAEIGRAHLWTPVTDQYPMPS